MNMIISTFILSGSTSRKSTFYLVIFLLLVTVISIPPTVAHCQDHGIKYVRVEHVDGVSYGIQEDEIVRELDGSPWANSKLTGNYWNVDEINYLPPVNPKEISKIIGVAVNTKRAGLNLPPNAHPKWFAKFPTSISTDGANILLPPEANNLNYEGELVVIIGKRTKNVSKDEALDYVFGYTVGNDYSENTWYVEEKEREEPSRMISKGTDTWANIGSFIISGIDYRDRRLVTKLNDVVVQDGNTNQIIQDVPELISYVSRYITLLPGDLIFTGTVPFLVDARRSLQPGDKLEVWIEDIGSVSSKIILMDLKPWNN